MSELLYELSDLDICAMTTSSQQPSEAFQQGGEPNKDISVLHPHVQSFSSIFVKEDFNVLPDYCQWDHTIDLIPGAEPKSSKIYFMSPVEQLELDAFFSENLHTSWICPSKSSMAAPVFFIKTKDSCL